MSDGFAVRDEAVDELEGPPSLKYLSPCAAPMPVSARRWAVHVQCRCSVGPHQCTAVRFVFFCHDSTAENYSIFFSTGICLCSSTAVLVCPDFSPAKLDHLLREFFWGKQSVLAYSVAFRFMDVRFREAVRMHAGSCEGASEAEKEENRKRPVRLYSLLQFAWPLAIPCVFWDFLSRLSVHGTLLHCTAGRCKESRVALLESFLK
jgi:hypothetical protein